MKDEDNELWVSFATLQKLPISQIPKIRKLLKETGYYITDKWDYGKIKLVLERTPSGNSEGGLTDTE